MVIKQDFQVCAFTFQGQTNRELALASLVRVSDKRMRSGSACAPLEHHYRARPLLKLLITVKLTKQIFVSFNDTFQTISTFI